MSFTAASWATHGSRMPRWIALLAVALSLVAGARAAGAQARDGDILVPEFTAGSVVNVRGGGDFAGAARFATGLSQPMGLCQGPGGHVYATERGAGQVTIITAGGDFTGAPAFATGLSGPASLLCTSTRILVTELDSSQITDITAGGSFAGAAPFATIDRNPADLLRDGSGRLWVTSFNDGVIEITAGGDFRGDPYYAPNDLADDSSITIARMRAALLVGNEHTDEIVDFTGGGPLSQRPVFARVRGVIGLRFIAQTDQLLAASELDGAIYDVTAGGDFRSGAAPFASGVGSFDVSQLVYVQRGCPDGDLDPGEECDDGNDSNTDACLDTCVAASCGDGFVQGGVEECDDGNLDPGDGCDAGCAVEVDPGDLDGGAPDAGAGGGDPDGGSTGGSPDGGGPGGGKPDGGSTGGAPDGGGTGSGGGSSGGCSAAGSVGPAAGTAGLAALLVLVPWIRRRRR